MLLDRADVVVVGAGIRGASIAYHLARAGVRVIVVDRGFIGSVTSGATFAMIIVSAKTPEEYVSLSLASAELYPGLSEELGVDIEFETGNLIYHVIEFEEHLEYARDYCDRLNAVPGITMNFLSPEEVRERQPAVCSANILGALHCPQDGRVNPFKLIYGYASNAERLGARFLSYHEVLGINVKGGRVTGVVTEHGEIGCDWVVNAAGIEAPRIGAMVGVDVPVVPHRAQVLTTEPMPGLLNQPLATIAPYIELVPTRAGPILILLETDNEFVGADRSVELPSMGHPVFQRVIKIVPALGEADIIRAWSGLRPMPLDGLPIMGPVIGLQGFIMATGHSGYTLAQITGKLTAELITTGRSSIPLRTFAVERFMETRYAFPLQAYRFGVAAQVQPA